MVYDPVGRSTHCSVCAASTRPGGVAFGPPVPVDGHEMPMCTRHTAAEYLDWLRVEEKQIEVTEEIILFGDRLAWSLCRLLEG